MIYDIIDKSLLPVTDKLRDGGRLTAEDALLLWEKAPLALLGVLAVERKRSVSGDTVFYNRNFHIEPTNICVFNCGFCSYRKPADSTEAWNLSLEEIARIAESYRGKPVTEAHIVGGVHPEHDLAFFEQVIRTVKQILPDVVVKAFTAIELAYIIEKSGLSIAEGLKRLSEAGMGAIPGGGAEIFDEQIRSRICPEKGSSEIWLRVHREAHELGIPTNATMLYGHIENIEHRIDHMDRLRGLQDETDGFNAFIPLKYRSFGNSMSALGEVSITEDLRLMALSRLYLDNFPHIKAYWPMFGKTVAELALSFGADDIDGTIDDTTKIYLMAGAEEKKPSLNVAEIEDLVRRAGWMPLERDTFYNPVKNR